MERLSIKNKISKKYWWNLIVNSLNPNYWFINTETFYEKEEKDSNWKLEDPYNKQYEPFDWNMCFVYVLVRNKNLKYFASYLITILKLLEPK